MLDHSLLLVKLFSSEVVCCGFLICFMFCLVLAWVFLLFWLFGFGFCLFYSFFNHQGDEP